MNDRLSSIEETEAVAGHLETVLRSIYQSLGATAPALSDDAIVVAVFEMARVFGTCAQRFGELRAHRNDVDPGQPTLIDAVNEVVVGSLQRDPTGALTLYAVCSVLGPRLLISLRDASVAASGPGDVALRHIVHEVAAVVVTQIQRGGELARGRTSFEDPQALQSARELDEMLNRAHFAESFGLYP